MRSGVVCVFRDLTRSCQIENPKKKQVFADACCGLLRGGQSFAAAGACAGSEAAGAAAAGAIDVGAAGRCLAAGCFLADAIAEAGDTGGEPAAVAAGACFAAADSAGRCPRGEPAVPGSGVMMLTAGVLAELGNSALVGRPVGTDAGNPATGTAAAGGGAFHDAA